MFNNQAAFEVHVKMYGRDAFCISRHRTIGGACRSLASLVANRKRKLNALEQAYVWCARDNHTYALNRARELLSEGYFDGPAYR
jgi:hypothetical protein